MVFPINVRKLAILILPAVNCQQTLHYIRATLAIFYKPFLYAKAIGSAILTDQRT